MSPLLGHAGAFDAVSLGRSRLADNALTPEAKVPAARLVMNNASASSNAA
ncbi:MAG: hypothetical protein ACLFQ1_01515 [Halochromatium sp.]